MACLRGNTCQSPPALLTSTRMFHATRAIPILCMLASIMMLLAMGGVDWNGAPRAASGSHGHTHRHAHGYSHDASTLSHVHAHPEMMSCRVLRNTGESLCVLDDCAADSTSHPHHHCCHEDHSHPTLVFTIVMSGSFWDEHIPSLSSPLPDLWQPAALDWPVIRPSYHPLRGGPGDTVSKLRTVVMLT